MKESVRGVAYSCNGSGRRTAGPVASKPYAPAETETDSGKHVEYPTSRWEKDGSGLSPGACGRNTSAPSGAALRGFFWVQEGHAAALVARRARIVSLMSAAWVGLCRWGYGASRFDDMQANNTFSTCHLDDHVGNLLKSSENRQDFRGQEVFSGFGLSFEDVEPAHNPKNPEYTPARSLLFLVLGSGNVRFLLPGVYAFE